MGTSHGLEPVSQSARIIRAPIDAARDFSNCHSSSVEPVVVSTPHMISQAALIRKGVFEFFFNFFSAGENGGGVGIQHIYSPYWYNDARVYHSVCILSSKSLSIFFLSGKFYTIPHPTYIPRAPSFHSTKILRYAIHAQYNCRGRECHTSGLICSWNLILWGLEARRARSLYLGEWLWG